MDATSASLSGDRDNLAVREEIWKQFKAVHEAAEKRRKAKTEHAVLITCVTYAIGLFT